MNIAEDKLDRQIYWLLHKLRMIALNPGETAQGFYYSFGEIPEMASPSFIQQRKIFKMLDAWEVIVLNATYDESSKECPIDNGVSFFFSPGHKFDAYFWGLMEKLIYSDAHLDSIEKGAECAIVMRDGNIYLNSPFIVLQINDKPLRHDGIPLAIISYLVNDAEGRLATIDDLKAKLRVGISRDLSQVAIKAGFKKLLNEHFMTVCDKNALQLRPKVTLTIKQMQGIIGQLMQEPVNFNALYNYSSLE